MWSYVITMVKYFESNTIYPYRWSQVIQGYWNRYPNPYSTHVLSEDTLYREVQDGKLYSKRMLYKTQGVPKWGEKFIGKKNFARIIEESVVDPKEKVFITYTKNIDFTRFMVSLIFSVECRKNIIFIWYITKRYYCFRVSSRKWCIRFLRIIQNGQLQKGQLGSTVMYLDLVDQFRRLD